MFIYPILQEVGMHLSQHTAFLKPLSFSVPCDFRNFLLSPGSTNKSGHFSLATQMYAVAAVPSCCHAHTAKPQFLCLLPSTPQLPQQLLFPHSLPVFTPSGLHSFVATSPFGVFNQRQMWNSR